MNVSLTPELEQLVNEKVRTGLYQTASEVVREALRLLKQRDDEARRAEQAALIVGESRRRVERPIGSGRKRERR
jgi:putative addiction module CopG family antidote